MTPHNQNDVFPPIHHASKTLIRILTNILFEQHHCLSIPITVFWAASDRVKIKKGFLFRALKFSYIDTTAMRRQNSTSNSGAVLRFFCGASIRVTGFRTIR